MMALQKGDLVQKKKKALFNVLICFSFQNIVISEKKGHHLQFMSKISIFVPKI